MPRLFILLFFFFFSLHPVKAQDELPQDDLSDTTDLSNIYNVSDTTDSQDYDDYQYVPPEENYLRSSIERHHFDTQKWKSLKEDMDYSKPDDYKKKEPEKESSSSGMKGFGQIFKFLLFLLAIGLIVLLIVHLAGGKELFAPKNRKIKSAVSGINLEKIEENLQEADLEDPIRQAVAAGDYPLAVRLYYLSILKELSLKKHIRWKRDKTNGAYLRELAGSPLFSTVQEVTLAFERVWYGKVELNHPDFLQLETKFKNVVAEVQR